MKESERGRWRCRLASLERFSVGSAGSIPRGPRFGWRRTGTLTTLQTEVNQGAVRIIVARRVVEAASVHIVAVVPVTDQHMAVRNPAGEVVAPVQIQAGGKNFCYSTHTVNWFKHAKFAEFGFWMHA